MKQAVVCTPRLFAVGVLLLLAPGHGLVANSKQQKQQATPSIDIAPMPTVKHEKEAGSGYQAGSPLFAKQQAQNTTKDANATVPSAAPAAPAPVATTVASGTARSHQILHTLIANMLYVLLVLTAAYVYRRYKTEQSKVEIPASEGMWFTHGLFDFHGFTEDTGICISACFCPGIRWADTVSMTKINLLKFWIALLIMLALAVLHVPTAGASGLVMLGVGVYFRQKLREAFGHDAKTPKTVALDCLTWCCCPCCAIVQEAREVENCQLTEKPRPICATQ